MEKSQKSFKPFLPCILYTVYCAFIPCLYGHTLPVSFFIHDFSQDPAYLEYFIRDSGYVIGMGVYASIALIKDAKVRVVIAQIAIADAIRELFFDLVPFNNQYDTKSVMINTVFMILAMSYAVFKLDRK